ncbi:Protein kinase domain [Quillaja saponaria]|uniref:Protein kinase domain n=1 Tax=Quillaja saponaria TaxID=32244 RepID=A0AAD7VNX0_QUISA|nr:Protein kinase domain [Quillaja saponaria]
MPAESQKVVVIQNASKDISTNAIKWALRGLSHKPGDELTLLAILHKVNNPSTFTFMGAAILLAFKIKVDSCSMFGINQKKIEEELTRKIEEYHSNAEIMEISKQCETDKILFQIEVLAGPSPEVVLNAVLDLKAKWVILDRKMKKDKKYFMENLPCGMLRMRRDNTVELMRGPKSTVNAEFDSAKRSNGYIKYKEMVAGSSDDELSPKTSDQLMAIAASSLRLTEASTSSTSSTTAEAKSSSNGKLEGQIPANTEQETAQKHSLFTISESQETDQREVCLAGRPVETQNQHSYNNEASQMEKEFKNSICTHCKNRRPPVGWKRDFSYAELLAATRGLSEKNFLSEGGFGSVYKGEIDGVKIAVKQHNNASLQGEKEFKSEVQVLSKARHENLVMLLGSCSEGNHRLLVYEYVCNGSLDQHLSQHSRTPVSWNNRIKIAIGVAKGLQYLHENNIIHRDMRPNNILVTHDHEPLLGDFGLARRHEDTGDSSETRVVGTLGYLAPEYAEYGRVSTKTDVYSFGVVLLQLITGMRTTDKRLGGKSLVGWARPLLKERNYPDLIDKRIMNSHDFHQLFWMVRVAEKCLSKDPHKRLRMATVSFHNATQKLTKFAYNTALLGFNSCLVLLRYTMSFSVMR